MLAFYIKKVLDRCARHLYMTMIYESKTGIKAINPLPKTHVALSGGPFSIAPSDLFLDVDWLTDEFTLCGRNISESPHYFLAKALHAGESIRDSEYLRRYAAGTLDVRSRANVTNRTAERISKAFHECVRAIGDGRCAPVKAYRVGGKCYIADGKHRAATHALLGKEVPVIWVDKAFLLDSSNAWKFSRMARSRKRYSVNLEFYKTAVMQGKEAQ